MSILSSIKNNIAKSGSSKGKVLYFKEGSKTRVRFLHEIEDFMEVTLHDSFESGMQLTLCPEHYGHACPYCEDESVKNKTGYVGTVYDHEAKETKLFLGYPHQWSPLPALVENFEARSTAKDRDYIISQTGKGTSKTFAVISNDKSPFKNAKAKPYSQKEIIKMLKAAFPAGDIDDSDDEDEAPKKKQPNKKDTTSKKRKSEPEVDEWDDEGEEDDVIDYTELSPKELYKLCKERDIDAAPKKKPAYYIELLEEYDEEQVDDGNDEDDDWEDDDEDEDGDDW